MGKQFRPRNAFSFLDLIPPEERGGPDPPTEEDQATDLELAFRSLAPSSIRGNVEAVRFRCKALEQPLPIGKGVANELRRIVRDGAGRGRGKAKGLRLHEVEKMAIL